MGYQSLPQGKLFHIGINMEDSDSGLYDSSYSKYRDTIKYGRDPIRGVVIAMSTLVGETRDLYMVCFLIKTLYMVIIKVRIKKSYCNYI